MKARGHAAPLSSNEHLLRWVEKMRTLCDPAAVHWVDGSAAELAAFFGAAPATP